MAPSVTLYDGSSTYYLINSTGAPVAGGAPTAASTTPFAIREDWWPKAAEPQDLYTGGPPFRSGSAPVWRAYGNVTEEIRIRVVGSTHVNAVANLQTLKRLLKRTSRLLPTLISVIPDGSSATLTTEIYSGYIQEEYNNETALTPVEGATSIDAVMRFVRHPFWGNNAGSGGENLLNAVTFTNSGAAGANVQALTSTKGDFIYEGQPLNIKIKPGSVGASGAPAHLWMASVYTNPQYSTIGTGTYATTSTVGVQAGTGANLDMSLPLSVPGIRPRIMARVSTSSVDEMWVVVTFPGAASAIYTSAPQAGSSTLGTATLIDFGSFTPPNILRQIDDSGLLSPVAQVQFWHRSTTGASGTLQFNSFEYLWCYDFCHIQVNGQITANGTTFLYQSAFPESTSGLLTHPGVLPFPTTQMITFTTGGTTWNSVEAIRGVAPRYYNGCLLWMEWIEATGAHVTTRVGTVTVTHAPLYHTLRGSA